MNFKRARNPYIYASITVIVLMMAGWFFGRLMATSDNTYMRLVLLQDVVNQIYLRYVDKIPQDQLYRRAVEGLLKALDPYTELIPAEEYKRFQEMQVKSEYLGTGISITRTNQEIVVMSTFPGSSAYREGIQPGDRIIQVDGKSTKDWTTEQASLHLLGEEGTTVETTVSRMGVTDPLEFTLTREPVTVPTVTRHFMLPNSVGYVRLANFTEPSAEELKECVENLAAEGMKSLILDLRDNGGGLTESAIDICDLFLSGRELIVSIRARMKEDSNSFFSKGNPVFKDQPMAVLVNEFTASSSEIVAGALQDHDRAVIVGKNSFGKGLVQTTFPLNSGDVLKITTARYYTPSGRNIQREHFSPIGRSFAEEEDTEQEPKAPATFETDMGREVLGGGGIAPDVEVAEDSAAFDPFVVELLPHSFDFAIAFKSLNPDIDKSFRADRKVFNAFVSFLKDKGVEVDDKIIDRHREFITDYLLTYRIAQVVWDDNTAYRLVTGSDRQLNKALEILGGSGSQIEFFEKIMKEGKD